MVYTYLKGVYYGNIAKAAFRKLESTVLYC